MYQKFERDVMTGWRKKHTVQPDSFSTVPYTVPMSTSLPELLMISGKTSGKSRPGKLPQSVNRSRICPKFQNPQYFRTPKLIPLMKTPDRMI